MKIIVCGGRAYNNQERVFAVLDAQHALVPIDTLIEGGASGADRLALNWAYLNGIEHIISCLAQWDLYGRSAGPRRNGEMLKLKPDLVIAFPGGRGTANMIRQARTNLVAVKEIEK